MIQAAMQIESLTIKNFKGFRDSTFYFHKRLNVLTGINNSGKTTVLEALALWAECFRRCVQPVRRTSRKTGVGAGNYRLSGGYVDHRDISSIRSPGYNSLFHELETKNPIQLIVTLQGMQIGIELRAARGLMYEIKSFSPQGNAHKLNRAANSLFGAWPDPVRVHYSSPVAVVRPYEEFETLPKIRRRLRTRESMQALRNRLYQFRKEPQYKDFGRDFGYILGTHVELKTESDEYKDVEVRVSARVGSSTVAKEISLLGSGTLQILEILLHAYGADSGDLNILLLDEPDSHIHRDLQVRLLEVLEQRTGYQVFATTHNESLLRSIRPESLFHLEGASHREYRPICESQSDFVRKGLQPSPHLKIFRSLGYETSLEFLNALEADCLVLVEGKDDARHIQAMCETLGPLGQPPPRVMYWSFSGIDELLRDLQVYKRLFTEFRNGHSLWEKTIIVFDRDILPDQVVSELREALVKQLAAPVFIWSAYTCESALLSDLGRLSRLLTKGDDVLPAVPVEAVDTAVKQGVEELGKDLQVHRGDDVELQTRNTLKDRRVALMHSLLKKKVVDRLIPEDGGKQLQLMQQHVRRVLDSQEFYKLATKDHVAELLTKVYAHVNSTFTLPEDWFERLIRISDPSTRIDQWQVLVDAIAKRRSGPRPV